MRFFLKCLILLLLLGGILAGGYWGGSKLYQYIAQARLSDWHAKKIVVSGVEGQLEKALHVLADPYQNQPFTIQDAVQLRDTILQQYPMLKKVSVKRGLFSGKLTVSAQHRVPLAKFVLPSGQTRYIDADSTVYEDARPNTSSVIPEVKLEGTAPEKLDSEFIDLVESTLKLNKELKFTLLQLNLTHNTVKMFLPDGNEIDFGPALQLKKKAARAAQVVTLVRKKYNTAFVVSFQSFKNGQIFLTPKSSENE